MPRVNIREVDLTGYETTTYTENVVLVPGVKIELLNADGSIKTDADGNELTLDGLYTTVSQFENKVAAIFTALENAESGESTGKLEEIKNCFIQDKGYAIAYLTLTGGLPIQYAGLYHLVVESEEESGETKYTVYPDVEELVETTESGAELPIKEFYQKYTDRGLYDPKIITTPDFDFIAEGFDEQSKGGKIDDYTKDALLTLIGEEAIKCAGDRGDAYALLSLTKDKKTSKDVNDWVQTNFATIAETIILRPGVTWTENESVEEYGSYGTVYSSNFTTTFDIVSPYMVFDSKNKYTAVKYTFENAVFPAFVDYILCYGKYTKVTPDWFAISGAVRGVCPLAKFKPLNKYGDADIQLFQPRSGGLNNVNRKHIGINPIAIVRPNVNVIWGNRTMHPLNAPINGSSDEIQLVASDFLNIRSLVCDVKKTLYRAARRYSFDPNSDALWFNFKSVITPLLEKMKSGEGIRDYQIVKVPTTKKALLAARIIISPIEAVEDFDLTVELTDAIEVVEG